jgi:DNA-binding CsgD family transcriptional regulator
MISTRILCRSFVGRVEELEHLLLRRRQAGDGHGGLALVGGEAGIGKSRLVCELRQRLNRQTSIVAASACREFAQRPLGPMLEILGQIARIGPDEVAGSTKSERLERIAATFERVTAKRTVVAIIEDLHWADIDLVQTLLLLVQRAARRRLLFVATYRDVDIVPEHPLFKWFGRLVREPAVSVVSLPRFTNRELDRLMALATEGVARLSAPVLNAVRARSDGNPLFAEELLRTAVDSLRARTSAAGPALPLSLHALVAERLQHCSSDERAVLRNASLFGRDFSVAQVTEIFGGDPLLQRPMLERLSGLQLLDAVEADAGRYRFRHALTRDAIYAEMPLESVRPLHLRIAEHLEASQRDASAPEALAHHFWAANRHEHAAEYYEIAGDAAIRLFAYDDAAVFYRRAADGFAGHAAARARACAKAARALVFAGDLDGGLALYERAAELHLELGEVAEVVRSRALMAGHLFDGGRRPAAIALLRETLPLAEGDAALRSRLQTRLAMTLARDARLGEAWEALRIIDPGALDPTAEATGEYYLCASELHAVRGEPEAWRICFERGVAIYEKLGHPGPLQIAHSNFADQALSLAETALARDHHRRAEELARTLHFDDQAIFPAQVELYAGNLTEARRIVESMPPSNRFVVRAMLAQVAIPLASALGDDAMLGRHLDHSLLADVQTGPLTPTQTRVAAAHAMAFAATLRLDEARALLERVLDSLADAYGMALPIVALATLLPQRAGEIRPLLEAAASPAGDRANKALLDFLDACIASSGGDTTAAAHALDAAKRFAAIGWPLLEARALEMAGEARRAVAIYKRCGAAGELRRIEFGEGASAQASPLGALTPRERELALQVASGKANRAVADALSIGEKAVEKYLTSIYGKLGLTSRAQLAALVASSQRRGE